MKYKAIVFDIDGTITQHISSWRFIHEELGLWDVLAGKYQEQFLAGKIDYKTFCYLDAAHWKGMKETEIDKLFDKVKYAKNAEKSITGLKRKGFKIIGISTGLQFLATKLKEKMGFDYVKTNRLHMRKGVATGGVIINIEHGGKGKIIKNIAQKLRIKTKEIIAVGDSGGDIPMMKKAGFSIAVNSSSSRVSKEADCTCKTQDFLEIKNKIEEVASMKKLVNLFYPSNFHLVSISNTYK